MRFIFVNDVSVLVDDVDDDVVPVADDDAAALEWMPLEAVQPEGFGLKSIRQAVIRFLDNTLSQT